MKERIIELKIELMTEDSFEPYGEVWDSKAYPADRRYSSPVHYQPEGDPVASVMWQPYGTLKFTKLERHFHDTHIFIPLQGSLAAVAVARATDEADPMAVPDPSSVRAFLIDGSKGFAYKRGTWHSLDRYILTPPGTTFITLSLIHI